MTWDPTQPTDNTKIRNLGIVIRPNWEAIENADSSFKPIGINFNNRTPLIVSNDPTAISDSYILYSKEDSDGSPQLFGIDENSVTSQFTSTDFDISSQNGHAVIPPGLLLEWGRQTVITPEGGTFAVTFSKEFGAIPFSVVMTIYAQPESDASRGFGIQNIGTLTTTGFTAQSFNSEVPGGTTMGWMAIGSL